jgi:NAD+ kinase
MNVLLVTKPTNWEQFGKAASQQEGLLRFKFLEESIDTIQQAHKEHYQCLEKTQSIMDELGINYTMIGRAENWPKNFAFDAIVTIGGDGTLLTASHNVGSSTIPVLGIRSSSSSVGYLCSTDETNLRPALTALKEGKVKTILCQRLRADVSFAETGQVKTTLPALNDFLFTNSNPAAITRYVLSLGSKKEPQRSSGIWIATATGSSAAIHAAGGTVQQRDDVNFQFLVRELYKFASEGSTLTQGFFDPDQKSLVIENHNNKALLAIDGQRIIIPLKFGDHVTFKRADPLRVCIK